MNELRTKTAVPSKVKFNYNNSEETQNSLEKKRVQYHCYHRENKTNLLFGEQSVDYSASWPSSGTDNFYFWFFCQS